MENTEMITWLIIYLSPVFLSILFLLFKTRRKRESSASSWRDFEYKVADYMKKKGYMFVKVGKGSQDGGRDVVGYKWRKKYIVQAKFYKGGVGVRYIREIAGVALKMDGKPVIATTGRLTKTAKIEAKQLGVVVWKF